MTSEDVVQRRHAIRTASPRLAHTLEDCLWRDFIKHVLSLANSKESPATLLTRLISLAALILVPTNQQGEMIVPVSRKETPDATPTRQK